MSAPTLHAAASRRRGRPEHGGLLTPFTHRASRTRLRLAIPPPKHLESLAARAADSTASVSVEPGNNEKPRKPDFAVQGPPASGSRTRCTARPHLRRLATETTRAASLPSETRPVVRLLNRHSHPHTPRLSSRASPIHYRVPATFGAIRRHLPVATRQLQTTGDPRRLRTTRAVNTRYLQLQTRIGLLVPPRRGNAPTRRGSSTKSRTTSRGWREDAGDASEQDPSYSASRRKRRRRSMPIGSIWGVGAAWSTFWDESEQGLSDSLPTALVGPFRKRLNDAEIPQRPRPVLRVSDESRHVPSPSPAPATRANPLSATYDAELGMPSPRNSIPNPCRAASGCKQVAKPALGLRISPRHLCRFDSGTRASRLASRAESSRAVSGCEQAQLENRTHLPARARNGHAPNKSYNSNRLVSLQHSSISTKLGLGSNTKRTGNVVAGAPTLGPRAGGTC